MGRSSKKAALGSLIELESCITLKHSRCWNPKSKLSTKRELGVGFGQITKAYKQDGSIRFDALKELRVKHRKELAELTWESIESRPDLQLRAVVLKSKDNYTYYKNDRVSNEVALHFGDAAYNGGIGGLDKERRACNLSKTCNPNVWFENVENYCLKSKAVLYGNRSACDINRHHVKEVMLVRLNKYRKFLEH